MNPNISHHNAHFIMRRHFLRRCNTGIGAGAIATYRRRTDADGTGGDDTG